MMKGCKFSNIQVLILIIMFLASMNFFEKYFFCVFLALVLMVLTRRMIHSDYIIIGLFLLSVSYIIIYPGSHTSISIILKRLSYPLCYLLGFNFFYNTIYNENYSPEFNEKKIISSVTCVALGSFLHYFLNMLYNPLATTRNTIDIWTGKTMAATGQTALAVLALAVFCTLIFSDLRFSIKMSAIAGVGVIYIYNFILGGRTLILVGVLLFLISLLFVGLNKRASQRLVLKFVSGILLCSFICLFIKNNWLGISTFILNSNFGMRFTEQTFLRDTRFAIKKEYCDLLFDFPFGGDLIYSHVGMYAHDIILDTYNDVGVLGTIFLVVFLFLSIREWIRVIKNKKYSEFFRLLLLCTLVSILVIFFIEPIIAGSPWLLCSYCFFSGMISAGNKQYAFMVEESY